MRKLAAVAAAALLVGSPAALAKDRNLQIVGAPTFPRAGQAWHATISVKVDGRLMPGMTPTVRIIGSTGRVVSVNSFSTAKLGIYRATVVFPAAGTWRVLVVDRQTGRAYEFGRMSVRS